MSHAVAKPYRGMGMEGFTARWYATNTGKVMDQFVALARRVADEVPHGGRVLEVAPGPGYFAVELAKLRKHHVSGLDISRTLCDIARRNAEQAKVNVDFRLGNASEMPFPDRSFDFIVCRAAFKNFSEPVKALQEMYRVLDTKGEILIIDLRRDASVESIGEAVDQMKLNTANSILTKLTFRMMLLKRAYTRRELEQMLKQTSFDQVRIIEESIGFEVTARRSA
jgi:ubiquinone/menaquinone biosynthesis C-methylase UbiE